MKGDATMNSVYAHFSIFTAMTLCNVLLAVSHGLAQSPNLRYVKQGFAMRLCFDNSGAFGHVVYPPTTSAPRDSIGLEYPIGQRYEHIYGGGPWVGGKLDTAVSGTSSQIKLVTTGYEGYGGGVNSLFEFNPGGSPVDTIWKVTGRGVPKPPSWNTYWGNLIPTMSISDNDHYCMFNDYVYPALNHRPLKLRVAQSSYVWNDPYAEAIHIVEYKIMNMGTKPIDSAYVGMFIDADVGPINVPGFYSHNYTGYFSNLRTGYVHNPVDIGSTPVGVALIGASRPLDSLRLAFRWWPLAASPITDASKYAVLSSGVIQPDEFPNLSDTRFLLSIGAFTIRPATDPTPDTLLVAVAIVSGQNLTVMGRNADRARIIYQNGGQVAVNEPGQQVPSHFELFQNYPNPFNPVTTIRYALPRSGHARLSVFNTLGEEVAVLVDHELTGGMHSAEWNAEGKSSGVYFYRLQAGDYRETKKLIVLR